MSEHLTKDTFLQKVFNYETNKEWKFEGELPCVVRFLGALVWSMQDGRPGFR